MFSSWQTHPRRWVWGMAIAFFSISLALVLHRYFTFYASYDQGIFNQVFWNGSQGRFFQSSLSSQLSTNVTHANEVPEVFYHRLGQHFTPALLLWLPFYSLAPNAATLAVLLVVLVTAGGLVLYPLACNHVKPPLAAMIVASYFSANAVLGPTWCNFHDISQMPLFVFSLLLGLERRWWWLYFPMALLIPLIREDSALVTLSLGFYFVVSRLGAAWLASQEGLSGRAAGILAGERWRRWGALLGADRAKRLEILLGLGLCLYSVTYILVLTNWGMPQFSADVSKRFMLERFGQYATGPEASTLQIILGMLSNPLQLVKELLSPPGRTAMYLFGHWLPLGLVPAIAPMAWLPAAGPLFKLLVAKGMSVLAINIRYAMGVVPGLFYGAIVWWGKHPERFENPKFRRFWAGCMVLSILITITANPNRTLSFLIPDSITPWVYVSPQSLWRHAGHIEKVLQEIPADASVTATTYLVPHLSSRREIVRFPESLQVTNDQRQTLNVTYVVADLEMMRRYQPAFGGDRGDLVRSVGVIDQVLKEGSYGILKVEDGVILMKRQTPSRAEASQQWQVFRQSVEALGILKPL